MAAEYELYTGTLIYKEIVFTFVFNRNELKLIPPQDKEELVLEWKKKKLGNGIYTLADPIPVGVNMLIGKCNETLHKIIFLPVKGVTLRFNNTVVSIPIAAYVIYRYDRGEIDRASFSCPEINYIYPVNQALTITLPSDESLANGVVMVGTESFDVTTTKRKTFVFENKEIQMYYGISRTISTKINEPPLRLDSSLMLEFDATEDYQLIYKLWLVVQEYISFLCYRKNVHIPKIELAAPVEDGRHEPCATMYFGGEAGETESDPLKKGYYIKRVHIAEHEAEILSDIALGKLYLRHLPDTYRLGRDYNAARFVMITAAFEWEFRRLYPNGVVKSDETKNAETEVQKRIKELIDETSGKQKNIYKFLAKLVRSDSLQNEIIQTGNDLAGITGVFGDHLYQINGEKLDYKEMGKRLADQRNHFAHGDLDKDFIGLSLLDLIYMQYIVYAMQLKQYGIEDSKIQGALNDLFQPGIAL